MKSFTSTNSNDVFCFGFPPPPDLTWSETAWNWLFQPLVAVFFQTSMSRPGSRRSPCKPFATPPWGVSTQCVWMNSLRFNARSTRRWWLALSKTTQTSDRRVDQECVLLCNQQKFCTWYQMVWHIMTWIIWIHTHSYTFIHCMPCSFASLLMNCKKTCCIIYPTCKKKHCFDQFLPKEIHPTDSQAPFTPGCRQWRWWPPALSVRAPSRVRKPVGFFVFSDPMIFFELEDPQIWEVCATWKSWKSRLMKYNLKSVVNVSYSLPGYSFDDDKKSPDSHISSRKRSHVYSLGFFYVF